MSLQSHSDWSNSPPMGEVNQPSKEDILHKLRGMQEKKYFSRLWRDSGFYGRKFIVPENLVDLDSESYLAIRTANGACNRTAPVLRFTNPSSMIAGCIMAIVHGVISICKAILDAILAFFAIILSCITCGKCGGRRRTTHSAV
ncbi:hypothetical protein NHJ13734_009705 [Beauveria thailandica]